MIENRLTEYLTAEPHIEEAAQKTLRDTVGFGLPIDVNKVANHLGFQAIYVIDLEPESMILPEVSRIFIREGLGDKTARFSVSHELGHFVLGYKANRLKQAENPNREYEADYFAAALLMPSGIFTRYLIGNFRIPYYDMIDIPDLFAVPDWAVDYRINQLAKYINRDLELLQKRSDKREDL